MGVTHVIRGEDHISNTPRQILIQEALGYSRPIYAHLPLILATDRSKMSKRHGAVAINEYRDAGFTKEAIINYLALLGWNPGTEQELFLLPELVEAFDESKIQKSGAVFNIDKFKWFNREYLTKLTDDEYVSYLDESTNSRLTSLPGYESTKLKKIVPLIKERTHTRAEFLETAEAGEYDFAFTNPTYETTLLAWKNDADVKAALPRLIKAKEILNTADFTSPETIKASLWKYAEEVGKGELFWPLRIALSGKAQSPDPFTIAHIIGITATLLRITAACDKIGGDV
jgi:glutamyl/glutaminyl-tRNA synthetase